MVIGMQFEQVKELITIFEKTDLNDMEVRLGDALVRLNRGLAPQSSCPETADIVSTAVTQSGSAVSAAASKTAEQTAEPAAEQSAQPEGETKLVKAPLLGTFYQSSAPDQPPYVKVGDTIAAGDVVCIIEAMKFMNEVKSEVSGTVIEILVEDGQFVEYGQELFRVK